MIRSTEQRRQLISLVYQHSISLAPAVDSQGSLSRRPARFVEDSQRCGDAVRRHGSFRCEATHSWRVAVGKRIVRDAQTNRQRPAAARNWFFEAVCRRAPARDARGP